MRARLVFGYTGPTGHNPVWQKGPNWFQVTWTKVIALIVVWGVR